MSGALEITETKLVVEAVIPSSTLELLQPSTFLEVLQDGDVVEVVGSTTLIEVVASPSVEIRETPTVITLETAALQGAPGAPGLGIAYVHTQAIASTAWSVQHNLGVIPSAVAVLDSAGTVVWGEINHVDMMSLVIRFSSPFAGTAYLR